MLIKELQSLCLDVKVLGENDTEIELKEFEDDTPAELEVNIEGNEDDLGLGSFDEFDTELDDDIAIDGDLDELGDIDDIDNISEGFSITDIDDDFGGLDSDVLSTLDADIDDTDGDF